MNTNKPTPDEKKNLIKLEKSAITFAYFPLITMAIFGLAQFLPDKFESVKIFISGGAFFALLTVIINRSCFKRCPRCSSWITAAKGQCPSCLLHLDPNYNDQSI